MFGISEGPILAEYPSVPSPLAHRRCRRGATLANVVDLLARLGSRDMRAQKRFPHEMALGQVDHV